MRIVAYARVSSKDQSLNSNALEQQIERLRAAGAQEIFVDVESGYKGRRRAELEKLMELVRNRQVSKVVVTRLDRLSRRGKQAFALFDDFLQSGVVLRALDEPIDLSTPSGKMAAGMLAVLAQHHSDQKSEAIRHGWEHLRRRKVAMQPPFGYCKVGSRHSLDTSPFLCLLSTKQEKSKADIAREIIEAFLQAEALRGCLRIINERYGIQTFAHHHRTGGLYARGLFRFSVTGLSHWLTSPVLQGHTCYLRKHGERDKNKWNIHLNTHPESVLVTLSIAQRIESILQRNYRVKGWGCSAPKYPLSGLVYCGECRSACYSLKANRGKSPGYNHYFQCKNWRSRGCQQKRTIRMEVIEEAVIRALIQKAEAIASVAKVERNAPSPEIQQLRQKLNKLETMADDPDIEEACEKLRSRIYSLEQQQENVSIAKSENQQLLNDSFGSPQYWQDTPDELKRTIYQALVDKVVVREGEVLEVRLKV